MIEFSTFFEAVTCCFTLPLLWENEWQPHGHFYLSTFSRWVRGWFSSELVICIDVHQLEQHRKNKRVRRPGHQMAEERQRDTSSIRWTIVLWSVVYSPCLQLSEVCVWWCPCPAGSSIINHKLPMTGSNTSTIDCKTMVHITGYGCTLYIGIA